MENIQYITLDIMNNKTNNFIYTKQYDVGREVVFSFTDNGSPLTLTGLTVIFSMKKPDGKYITYSGSENMTLSASTVTLEFTEQMTVLYGKLPYQLSLVDGTPEEVAEGTATIISTVNGYIICDKAAVQREDLVSESDGSYAADVMTAHESVEAAVEAAGDAADYAKISKSYAIGGTDYQHDGKSDTQDNAKFYCETMDALYNRLFYSIKITLKANAWSKSFQTVSCRGVLADEDQQLVVVRPYAEATPEYVDCGIACTAQGDNQLTFRCKEVPAHDLDVYVMIQEALHPFADFVGADGVNEGKAGLVPAPSAADNTKFLRGDGTWATVSGGGSGTVTDVTVDDVSVVSGGVARIDFTGLQPLLSPGRNITISNGTISATDTKYDPFTGGTSGLVPSATPSDHGKYLKADGTWDTPSGGGGGGGAVDDVQVNGVSVVSNGVAYIDLSGKQNTLTPGSNIIISNNTISATDSKVSQNLVSTATSSEYRLLLSGTPDDINRSEGTYKYTRLTYNPNTSRLKVVATDGDVSINGLSVSVNGILHGGCSLTMTGDDLTLSSSGNTQKWDGTNTSLRNAVAALRADVDAGITGTSVVQTATNTGNYNYELLFSNTADNTTRTEGTRKSENLYYNPAEKGIFVVSAASDTSTELHPWSLKLNSGLVYMEIAYDDIRLSGQTWDGTNTSLYNTIFNKLSRSGGTMTGNIVTPSDVTSTEFGIYPATANNGFIGSDTNYYYAMHSDYYNGIYLRAFEDDDFSTLKKYSQLKYDDINLYGLNNTWDGDNTSLKLALDGKLATSGGTMTGYVDWDAPSSSATDTGTRIGTDTLIISHDHGGVIDMTTSPSNASISVARYGYDSVTIEYDDIINTATWDGTNINLTTAFSDMLSTGETVKQNAVMASSDSPVLFGAPVSTAPIVAETYKSTTLYYNTTSQSLINNLNNTDKVTMGVDLISVYHAGNTGGTMTIEYDDIVSTKTWDGTNSSLKAAIAASNSGVAQNNASGNNYYPILFSDSTSSSNVVSGTYKSMTMRFNPSTNTFRLWGESAVLPVVYDESVSFNHSGIEVGKWVQDGGSVVSIVSVTNNDVINTSTWDNTNTSLKTSITALNTNKLSLTGGTMRDSIITPDNNMSSMYGIYPNTANNGIVGSASHYYYAMHSNYYNGMCVRVFEDADFSTSDRYAQLGYNDLYLYGTSNTWDGTNTSLKTAITAVNTAATTAAGTVTQTNEGGSSSSSTYYLLYSGSTSMGTQTGGVRKHVSLTYNPYHQILANTGNNYQVEITPVSVSVYKYAQETSDERQLTVGYEDITLSRSTWDGTNTSLKTAISDKVSDVRIGDLSLVSDGVASIPIFQGSSKGLVPTATSADANKFLRGNGTWGTTAAISFPAANEWNWNVWRETYNYSWTAGTYKYIQCCYDKSTVDPTYGDLSDIKVLVQGVEITGKDSNNQEHSTMGVLESAVDLNGELCVYIRAYNYGNVDFVSYEIATTVTFVGDNYNG